MHACVDVQAAPYLHAHHARYSPHNRVDVLYSQDSFLLEASLIPLRAACAALGRTLGLRREVSRA